MSAFPRVFSPFVSHCDPFCSCRWMVRPPPTRSCFPLLDGVSAFSPLRPCFFPFVGCPSPRVSSPFVSNCALACFLLLEGVAPSRGSCLPLCSILRPMACPPSRGFFPLVSHCATFSCVLLDGVFAFPAATSTIHALEQIAKCQGNN